MLKYHVREAVGVEIPASAEVIHVGAQEDRVHVWALVPVGDEDLTLTKHLFYVGTGQTVELDERARFVGGCMIGRFVWHVLEVSPRGR